MSFESRQFFKQFKTNKCHHGDPLQWRARGNCPRCPPLIRPCLGLLLFNICISDLQTIISRKYAYADDLPIMHADGDWQAVVGVLSKDMATMDNNLKTCGG